MVSDVGHFLNIFLVICMSYFKKKYLDLLLIFFNEIVVVSCLNSLYTLNIYPLSGV